MEKLEDMKNVVLHFAGIEGNPEFQIKCDIGREKGGTLEFPCRCRFLLRDEKSCTFGSFMDLLAATYQLSSVTTPENSHWGNEKLKNFKADHIFCNKDPDQEMRFTEILLQRRAILNEELGLVKIDGRTRIAVIPDSDIIESAFFYLRLKDMFSDTLPSLTKPKKGGPLSKTVKETLQEASKDKENALTDAQLADLFNNDSCATKKKNAKKASMKRPNRGKAPNNIRKTKKPAKL